MERYGQLLLFFPVLLFSVVVHEYAHARVALSQGDRTAAMLGRITLNPIPHIDLLGSIIVPIVLWLSPGGFLIGWAKPVPVNPRNFRNYRRGDILVSAAGVAANFALAVVFTLMVVVINRLVGVVGESVLEPLKLLRYMAAFGIYINLLLGVFNLFPVPPLDGSHLLYHMLPPRLGARYREFGRFGIGILFLFLLVPGLLSVLLRPVDLLMGVSAAVIGWLG